MHKMIGPIDLVKATKRKFNGKIRMKRIKLFIHEPTINKVIGRELNLSLDSKANLIDTINEVDKMISSKGSFPVPDYQSLLHMIYNPLENRFYKQVALTAYKQSGHSLNVRDDLKKEIPEGITVTLIPAGGCISEWEEVVDYKKIFRINMKLDAYKY